MNIKIQSILKNNMFIYNILIYEVLVAENRKKRNENHKLEILINFLTHFPRGSFYAIKVSIVLNNRLLEQDIKTHNKTNKTMLLTL